MTAPRDPARREEYLARERARNVRRAARRMHAPTPAAPPAPVTLDDERRAERERRDGIGTRASLRRALARVDELEGVVATLERYTAEPLRAVEPAPSRRGRHAAAAVALLSDVHAEERVERTPAIPNEYSLAHAERRLARFFGGLGWLLTDCARTYDVGTLVLWLGGDLISGDIHDELLERCEVPPGEAMLRVRDWIAAGITRVCTEHPTLDVLVPCSVGNHARTTDRMRAATGYGHSWEWVLYNVLASDFRHDTRVRFHAPKDELVYVDVLDMSLAFHHGHRLRYNGGIGGLTIPMIKAVHRWQAWRDCDFYSFGHFHTRLDLGQIAVNGSVIGPNAYGLSIGARPEVPQQSFFLLDAERGKTRVEPIWVTE